MNADNCKMFSAFREYLYRDICSVLVLLASTNGTVLLLIGTALTAISDIYVAFTHVGFVCTFLMFLVIQ